MKFGVVKKLATAPQLLNVKNQGLNWALTTSKACAGMLVTSGVGVTRNEQTNTHRKTVSKHT